MTVTAVRITGNDITLSVTIDDRVRRALIRHFLAFLKTKITERGFTADDPELFDQDQLEDKAWHLAAQVVGRTEERAGDLIDEIRGMHEAVEHMGGDPSPEAIVRDELAEVLPEVEREFVEDELGGLNMLIELASGHFPEIR